MGHSIIAQVTSRDISQSRHSSLLPFDSLSPNDDIQLFLSFPELSCIIAKAIQLNYLFKRLKFQSNLFCNLAYRIAVWRMIHGWSRNWIGVQRGIEISILPREQIEMSVQDDLLAEMKRKKLKKKKKKLYWAEIEMHMGSSFCAWLPLGYRIQSCTVWRCSQ